MPTEEFAGGCSVTDLLAYFDRRTPLNVAYLLPLGTVRQEVLGSGSVRGTNADLRAMAALVAQGLDEGAVGVSTGLEYVPGVFADLAELTALCEPAARISAPYVSHLRSYDNGAQVGMAEVAELGKATGIPLHVSHYRGRAEQLIARLEDCLANGLDVTFDSYPHLWANTILAMKALPATLQEGGVDATLRRLADPAVREDLARDWFPGIEATIAPSVLGFVASPKLRWAEGLTVSAAAERLGMSLGDAVCELILRSDLAVGAIVPAPRGAGESDVRELLRHPAHLGCSDGIYLGGHPHPRGWGAFAQFLGKHTRELGDWTWNEASWHLSGHPAARFGLAGRGTLAVGNVADIAVVDPATVGDRATYEEPRLLASGVDHVLVAGEPVLVEGKLTGATPGRALRRGEVGL
jgi:N-acyl-D-amino-acid deacylase